MKKKQIRSNSIIYLLERTLRQSRMMLQKFFDESELNISVDQWIVLTQIANQSNQNQRQIAEAVAKDPASITRILDLLEKQKFIKRIADKNDLRNSLVLITPLGKKTVQSCAAEVVRFKKVAGKGVSQEDLNQLKSVLDNLF